MKSFKVLLLILCGLLVFSVGCKFHDYKCEDQVGHRWMLPKELNDYLPYQIGEQLLFLNEYGDSLRFEVQNVDLLDYDNAYYEYTWNPCYPTGMLYEYGVALVKTPPTYLSDRYGLQQINLEFGGTASGGNGQNVNVTFFFRSDMYDRQDMASSESQSGDVQSLSDTLVMRNGRYVSEAVVVKSVGLVQYNDTRDNCTWCLSR